MKGFKVLTPGGYTTVQDLGRHGFAHCGVPVSGTLDRFSARIANLLVGNDESSALLELTVMGPSIEILSDMDIALSGASMAMTINEKPVAQWQSVRVKSGDILAISQITEGCRSYLAFGGGIEVPSVMGSFATYAGGKLGGFKGRPLKAGDTIFCHDTQLLARPRILPGDFIPSYPSRVILRVIPGPQEDYFNMDSTPMFDSDYMVTAKADRMGYRLQGEPIPIKEDMPKSIVSEPAMPGSIQIPPDEQPIILLVEQTVGGYAKIATVISSDLPRMAQATPGDTIAFEKIDLNTAHDIHKKEKQKLDTIKLCLLSP